MGAGLLRAERTRVWRSASTGLDAPAGCEILLEGTIDPDETALEGPFGDHTGYYNAQDHFPVMTITRMQLRRDAIYQGSYMGRAPHDEPSVMAMALNDVFVPILRKVFPEIVDFHLPPEACSYRIAVVSSAPSPPSATTASLAGSRNVRMYWLAPSEIRCAAQVLAIPIAHSYDDGRQGVH